jgi:OmpA-OmpF porin, OOP family
MNIMDFVKPYITDAITQKASAWLGESQSGVAKAIAALLPTIMSMILSKSDNRGFVDSLGGMLGDNRLNAESVLGNVGSMFSADHAASPLGQLGGGFLSQLFGDKMSGVASAIGQHAGIGAGSVTKILGAVAPMILALLGKQSAARGGIGSLLGMLGGQKAGLMAMVPGSVGSLLGLSGGAASAASSFSANQSASQSKDNGGGGWLWVVPLVAALGFAGWYFTRGHSEPAPTPVAAAPAVVAEPVVAPVTPIVAEPVAVPSVDLGAFGERMLPGDVKLNIPANGIESKLVGFIEDSAQMVDKEVWFDFDRIYFDTGSATLTSQSDEQVNNIATILKAFPNVQLKIGGYTDSTGDAAANLTLSQSRADSVMASVVALGVDAMRLKAEGYGVQHPIADNATEEGRQKNRRVSVRVTAK